ncbi:hypothetical protein JCM3765_001516 [Sporobolomyces pararoseus]
MNQLVGAPDWITPFWRLPRQDRSPPLAGATSVDPVQLGLTSTSSSPFQTRLQPLSRQSQHPVPLAPFSPPSLPFETTPPTSFPPTPRAHLVSRAFKDPSPPLSTASHPPTRAKAPHRPQARTTGGGRGGGQRRIANTRPGSSSRHTNDSEDEDGDIDQSERIPVLEWQASIPFPFKSRCCCSDEPPVIPRSHQHYHVLSADSTIPSNASGTPIEVQQKSQREYEAQLDHLRQQHLLALGGWSGKALNKEEKKAYTQGRDQTKKVLQKAKRKYEAYLAKSGRSPSKSELESEHRYEDSLRERAEFVWSRQV